VRNTYFFINAIIKNKNWHWFIIALIKKHIRSEKWSLHSFLTTASQQADVASNILLFFYKKKTKQNKKYEKWSLHLFLTTALQQADVAGNILFIFCFLLFSFCKKIIKYY
jgi:hypothetical protein